MSLVLAATSPSEPQRERSLRPPTEGLVLGLIGARWATFTAKTRPKSTSPNERGRLEDSLKARLSYQEPLTDIDQLRGGSPAYARGQPSRLPWSRRAAARGARTCAPRSAITSRGTTSSPRTGRLSRDTCRR